MESRVLREGPPKSASYDLSLESLGGDSYRVLNSNTKDVLGTFDNYADAQAFINSGAYRP